MALRFDFVATIQRFAVFCLTSNMLVKRHSYLLALGLLTDVHVIGTLGLLSVNPSGVDTIVASRISLRFFGRHTYLHVDISFLCFSYICVQKKTWCIMIGQYQQSSYDIQDVMIVTYI